VHDFVSSLFDYDLLAKRVASLADATVGALQGARLAVTGRRSSSRSTGPTSTRTTSPPCAPPDYQARATPLLWKTTDQVLAVLVDKMAFCRSDTNSYSVPPEHVGRILTLAANDCEVHILDGATRVAQHARCWGRRQIIEATEHREAILAQKQGAKGRDRLRAAAPPSTPSRSTASRQALRTRHARGRMLAQACIWQLLVFGAPGRARRGAHARRWSPEAEVGSDVPQQPVRIFSENWLQLHAAISRAAHPRELVVVNAPHVPLQHWRTSP